MRLLSMIVISTVFLHCQPGVCEHTKPNVVLVTIDALRFDHCSCYDYHRKTTPSLDFLAEAGIRFDQVIVPLPRTTQALASLLTSRDPLSHHVLGLAHRLEDKFTSISEVFSSSGYQTAAFVNHPMRILGAAKNAGNLGQGFDKSWGKFSNINRAVSWIQNCNEPFFIWIHLFEPHWLYEPGPSARIFAKPNYAHGRFKRLVTRTPKGAITFRNNWSDSDIQYAIDLYDGEILNADMKLRKILNAMSEEKMKSAYIAVLADHGEGLGEHNYYFDHGEALYDEVIRIPWVLTGPDMDRFKSRFTPQVSIVDVVPTLLGLAGIPVPEDFEGINLIPWLLKSSTVSNPPRPYICGLSDISKIPQNPNKYMRKNEGRLRFVRTDTWKLIMIPTREGPGILHLFNLRIDPSETVNLATKNPEKTRVLLQKINDYLGSWRESAQWIDFPERDMDAEDVRALKSLGYIN